MRIGILTSGGDCPGLNAAIRGVVRAAKLQYDAKVIGILNGFSGLVNKEIIEFRDEDCSGILTRGGTILGTSRESHKKLTRTEEGKFRLKKMINNYNQLELDCLVVLGGNGSHKTANLLMESGLNILTIPKTIDNDIWGTEVAIGFHTAVEIAVQVIDRIHTTAESHKRVMVIELMGHKTGWITLFAGLSSGADIILIPEIPYDIDKVVEVLNKRLEKGKTFSIVAIAEGALSKEEAEIGRKAATKLWKEQGYPSAGYKIADLINKHIGLETRVTVPGYQQRGGIPCSYDRAIATQMGTYAAESIDNEEFGQMIGIVDGEIKKVPISEVAYKLKTVDIDNYLIKSAKKLGIGFGV